MLFPEKYRITLHHKLGPANSHFVTNPGEPFGAFHVPVQSGPRTAHFWVIANAARPELPTAEQWDHVSVSQCSVNGVPTKECPNWHQMCRIKDLFWHKNTTVVQFHPKESEYINRHPFVLHLWHHIHGHTLPPSAMV